MIPSFTRELLFYWFKLNAVNLQNIQPYTTIMKRKKIPLVLFVLISCISISVSKAQENKLPLSISASFYSENYSDIYYSAVSYFYHNGAHVGLNYTFFCWKNHPKKKPERNGQLEGILGFNASYNQYLYISKNMYYSVDLHVRKTFHFGLFTDLCLNYGLKNYYFQYPVITQTDNSYVENDHYSTATSYPAYGFGIGWDFEKNFSIPVSLFIKLMAYDDLGSYRKTNSFIGLSYKFEKLKLPAIILN
jgi:hypothetical protein